MTEFFVDLNETYSIKREEFIDWLIIVRFLRSTLLHGVKFLKLFIMPSLVRTRERFYLTVTCRKN